ncbi:methyl-accepting chemotaxis protein [Hydrogenophaga aquatica]
MSMNNIRLGYRLTLGFGAVFALLAAVVAISVVQSRELLQELNQTLRMERSALLADNWAVSTRLNVNRVMAIAKSRNDAQVEAYFAPLIAQTTQQINELQKALESTVESADGKALMERIAKQRADYIAVRKTFFDTLKAGDESGADGILNDKLIPAANAYMASQDELVKLQHRLVDEFASRADSDAARSNMLVIALAAGAVALGVLVAVSIVRSITRPVREAVDVASGIAHGDLTRRIQTQRQDELGDLLRSLDEMQSSLLKVVGQIRQSSDSIQVASGEVASGNQDLSARTEQTASNLEETASSMEELTSTVRQTADAARQANQLASSAAEVAQRGGSVVGQVVTTMDEINHSSQKISDIISVIDGIAFQTNILALNAAVEAARAGEQGRGFAVVAGEVRTLAQRSAQAAKEIKELINTSVEKVQSGSRLVQDAGTTMREIVESVQRVTDIIGEITAAAGEQSDGIAQVNTAVNQLDQMTQQNAALVEQSAAAAESLREQAARMSQAIAVFRTGGNDFQAVAAPSHRPAPSAVKPAAAAAAKTAPKPVAGAKLPSPAAHPDSKVKGLATAARAAEPAPTSRPEAELKRPQLAAASSPKKAQPAREEGEWESF